MTHQTLSRSSPINWLVIGFFVLLLAVVVSVFPQPFLLICISLLVLGLFFFYYGRMAMVALAVTTSILLAYRLPLSIANITPFRGVVFLGIFYLLADILFRSSRLRLRYNYKLRSLLFFSFPLLFVFVVGVLRNINDSQAIFKGLSFALAISNAFLMSYFLTKRQDYLKIIRLQIITGVILSLYGLYEFSVTLLTGERPKLPFAQFGFESIVDKSSTAFDVQLELLRVESFLNDSNILAIYLVSALLFCLVFVGEQKTRTRKILFAIAVVLLSLSIILSLSRSGIIGLCFGLSYLLLRAQKRKIRVWSRFAVGGIVAAIFLLGFYLINHTFAEYIQGLVYRFSVITAESRRIGFILDGLNTFVEHPFAGVGVSNLVQNGIEINTFHSSYLTILAELGVVGGISLVIFFLPVLIMLWRTFLSRKASPLGIGFSSSIIAIMVFELFYDTLFLSPTTLIIWSIAYSFSLSQFKLFPLTRNYDIQAQN